MRTRPLLTHRCCSEGVAVNDFGDRPHLPGPSSTADHTQMVLVASLQRLVRQCGCDGSPRATVPLNEMTLRAFDDVLSDGLARSQMRRRS